MPALAKAEAAAIRASGLAIYLECGDSDAFGLQDGAEYLHRVLWDCDISHEYRLTRGADHVGPDMRGRQREALAFLGRVLRGAPAGPALSPEVRAWLDTRESVALPAVDFGSPAGPLVLRRVLRDERLAAAAVDPDTNRHFGRIRFDYPGEGCHN